MPLLSVSKRYFDSYEIQIIVSEVDGVYRAVCGPHFESGLTCSIYQNFQWLLKHHVYTSKDKGPLSTTDKLLKHRQRTIDILGFILITGTNIHVGPLRNTKVHLTTQRSLCNIVKGPLSNKQRFSQQHKDSLKHTKLLLATQAKVH